ncbi:MAG: basic secretory protein-like protein [Clostridium sp.]
MSINTTTNLSWTAVTSPKVTYIKENELGAKLFDELYPDATALIQELCQTVAKLLYKKPEEVPFFNKITFKIDSHEGVAYKNGASPEALIVVSAKYLENFKNSGRDLATEIRGVLTHEIVHIYQFDSGIELFILEGIADLSRYLADSIPLDARKVGGNYSDSYKTTGFFLDWLRAKNIDKYDFLYELNKSASKENNGEWSINAQFEELAGGNVLDLWNEYQAELEANGVNTLTSKNM